MEYIYVINLASINEVWDNQLFQVLPAEEEEKSFSQLEDLWVGSCPKLVHVIPSSMLPRLQNLKELTIEGCDSLICEVEGLNSGERSVAVAREMKFLPQLRELRLQRLPSLRYTGLEKKEFYANLTTLQIKNCDSLRNVFSIYSARRNLVHLQTLDIESCSKMEEIVGGAAAAAAAKGRGRGEGEGEEAGSSNDEILVFQELESLRLVNLPSLKGFCCSSKFDEKEAAKEVDLEVVIPPTQSLFYHKVQMSLP